MVLKGCLPPSLQPHSFPLKWLLRGNQPCGFGISRIGSHFHTTYAHVVQAQQFFLYLRWNVVLNLQGFIYWGGGGGGGGGGGREEASPPKKSLLKLNYRQRLTHGMLTPSRRQMLMTAPPRKRL